MKNILCVILGGGRGSRLFPLTERRAKPAVPLFGKYRLIDIPISNCLNSGLQKIYILTQFNSESLNKHVARTYKLDQFGRGFVEIMAADQTMDGTDWFQGTADAVRRCLKHFNDPAIEQVLILSGDQLYKMDLKEIIDFHRAKNAEVTVACNPLGLDQISNYGIMGADKNGRIKRFVEKPAKESLVKGLHTTVDGRRCYAGSMGIYLFNKDTLVDVLARDKKSDFGREIIPDRIKTNQAYAYMFNGYWRDLGTMESFYKENLALTDPLPPIDMFDEDWLIYSRPRYLSPGKIRDCHIDRSLVSEGVILDTARIMHSVIGLRSRIGMGSLIEDAIVMGCDYYEDLDSLKSNLSRNIPSLGIGKNCVIKRAILDKNVRVGDDVKIVNEKGVIRFDAPNYLIRDGIVIVAKDRVIPAGTVI